jgi:hydrogenase nickel incorporation protein HypA/HybF
MHELSIALSIVDMAIEVAEREGGGRVVAIHLRLGPLSGVVPEALVSAFELARAGSPLESVELVVERVPVVTYCETCNSEGTPASMQQLICRDCGSPTPQILQGRELEVTALEIVS